MQLLSWSVFLAALNPCRDWGGIFKANDITFEDIYGTNCGADFE